MPSTLGVMGVMQARSVAPIFMSVATQASVTGSTTSIVQAKPSGLVDGDYMLALVMTQNTVTPPTVGAHAWTLIATSIDATQKIYGKVASGEPANSTWVSSGSTLGRWNVHTMRYGSCSGVDVTGTFKASPAQNTMAWAAITTTVPNTLAVHTCFQTTAVNVVSPAPTAATTRVIDNGTSGARGIISDMAGPASAGVYSAKSGSVSASSIRWDCVLVMLKP